MILITLNRKWDSGLHSQSGTWNTFTECPFSARICACRIRLDDSEYHRWVPILVQLPGEHIYHH